LEYLEKNAYLIVDLDDPILGCRVFGGEKHSAGT
jgi:hypothetical protein